MTVWEKVPKVKTCLERVAMRNKQKVEEEREPEIRFVVAEGEVWIDGHTAGSNEFDKFFNNHQYTWATPTFVNTECGVRTQQTVVVEKLGPPPQPAPFAVAVKANRERDYRKLKPRGLRFANGGVVFNGDPHIDGNQFCTCSKCKDGESSYSSGISVIEQYLTDVSRDNIRL